MATNTAEQIHDVVQKRYGAIARNRGTGAQGCCSVPEGSIVTTADPEAIGYSADDVAKAGDANLGLGCGNPLALASIEPGMTVLDLGSGAGFDAFLARERVGETGQVIGVDMTDDMLELARKNAAARGLKNVEFRKGFIEKLPVGGNSVDLVISNCVINLSPDKPAVLSEIARVLKPGGQFWFSDIVLLRPLPKAVAENVAAYVGCVAGASQLSEYIALLGDAGMTDISVPQITTGASLLEAMAPALLKEAAGSMSQQDIRLASSAVVSAKFHGRKPAGAANPELPGCCKPGCCS
jgi:Methylase involved in ubiquinone/menaquinone biosynthesis